MFHHDDLFARHDPFGSFSALAAEAQAQVNAFRLDVAIETCRDLSKTTIREILLECRESLDLRPAVMRAIHDKAMLIDAFEAFRITAMHVSSRLAKKTVRLKSQDWVEREAEHAVKACVLQEQRRCAEQLPMKDPLPDHHASLKCVFEIDDHLLRYATTRINDLSDEQRIPIVRVFLQGLPIQDVVMESGQDLLEITQSMKVGLMTLQLEQIDGSE